MKLVKRIAAAMAVVLMLSSCSLLSTGTAQQPTATTTGSNTGSALAILYQILMNNGGINLGDLTNLINLGQILTGANSLTNASAAYTQEFANGLIQGSSNLINSSNVSTVISGLRELTKVDTANITRAASYAQKGTTPSLNNTSRGVPQTMSTLTNMLKAL